MSHFTHYLKSALLILTLLGSAICVQGAEDFRVDGIRYTVPQTVHPGDTAEIYFRFSDVSRSVTVTAYADGVEKAKKKVPRAAPGEMQKIKLTVPENCEHVRIGMSK